MVDNKMVEKSTAGRGMVMGHFFLPTSLMFHLFNIVLPVSFSLDTESYFVMKRKSTLTELFNVQIYPYRIHVAIGF